MSTLARSARIYLTFARYRLDDLLPERFRSAPVRLALLPWRLLRRPPGNRGARLRQALEDLGPIFVKFGQLLSTRPDLLPPDMLGELNRLQDNVAPFPSAEFKAVVEKALGGRTEDLFAEFSEHPLASASIAQVHTARLLDGTEVVIKAVRPHIGKVIRKDVELMERIAQLLNKYVPELRRLRPVEVVREYRETIFDELDLLRETANASQLRRLWQGSPLLYVPEVYWDYCRPNMMVMERIHGIQVTDLAEFQRREVDIKVLAERGVEIFFTQVFEHNFFHADMHPGNVYVDASDPAAPSYISLDMAIIGTLSREDQFYLARNLLAMFRRDYRQVAELHVMSGWVPPGTSIGAFEAAIRTVCEPIFQKPIKDIAFGDALVKLFQTARRFDMPVQPQLVLLQKTLVNIEGLGRQLYPDLDLWATAKPFLERWVKKRFNPVALLREMRRQGPDFAERAPQLPALVWDSINGVRRVGEAAPVLEAAAAALTLETQARPKRQRRRVIGMVALALGVWRSLPEGSVIALDSLLLVGVGLLALLLA